jgi:DNA-binding CsgD family transcriptional regulator
MARRKRLGTPLSPDDLRVLGLIADGLTDREVAITFGLEFYAVRTHIRRVLSACGARSRAQAVAWAYENGLFVLGRSPIQCGCLPGDGLREFAAGLKPGVGSLANPSQLWREGYKAGVRASVRAAKTKAAELDKVTVRTAPSSVWD